MKNLKLIQDKWIKNMVYILETKERVCLKLGKIIRLEVYNYWVIYDGQTETNIEIRLLKK